MPLVLQHRGPNKKPLNVLVQYRGQGHNKMPVKPVQKIPQILPLLDGNQVRTIHAWNQRDHDAVYDLDPLIDAMEAENAVAAFEHLPVTSDVEHHILTFMKRSDGN
jgi:hypothetical protein